MSYMGSLQGTRYHMSDCVSPVLRPVITQASNSTLVVHFYSILPLLVPIINASQRHLAAAISRRTGLGGLMSRYGNREGGGMEAVNDACVVPPAKGIRCCVPLSAFYYRESRKLYLMSAFRMP
ncbi:hypothetical protein TNCV_43621 [Trichonephila clavipes]|nr:hypothetical protein TNCV_43621 [Trichonephila clavipes]